MTQITHKGQHLLRHKAQDIKYNNSIQPAVRDVKTALDNVYSSLFTVLVWKEPVATKADLPLVGNTINDARGVQDDGAGLPGIYVCIATTGTVDEQWEKIANIDWMGNEVKVVAYADSPFTAAIENMLLVDTTGGDVVVNLPSAASHINKFYDIKNYVSTPYDVLIYPDDPSEFIEGETSAVLSEAGTCLTLVSDGSHWHIL